jgi:hypothetical protein
VNDPTGFETRDDEALEQAVVDAGNALADAMGWHADRSDFQVARTALRGGRAAIEAPLRAEIKRLQDHLDVTRNMLRLECAEFDDNDWPDDLHLADVVEKHLARSAWNVIHDLERERNTPMAQVKAPTNSLRAANATTRTAQARAAEAERRAERMEQALRRLEQWDMLWLKPDGTGAATGDAPWDRRLIADALGPADAYKAARGVVPIPPGGLSPEDAIRKGRGDS